MNTKILSALLGAMGLLMSAAAVAQMPRGEDPHAMRHDMPQHRSPVAKCRDGSVSYKHARTCSHHGGVRRWYHR